MNKNSKGNYIYNWDGNKKTIKKIEVYDETLRDGLQGIYVKYPSKEQKLLLLKKMEEVGIHWVNIGIPANGKEQKDDMAFLAKYVKEKKLKIQLSSGARTILSDVDAVIDVSLRAGFPLEAGIFIGCSKIRRLVEKWDLKEMGDSVAESVTRAVKNGLEVMFVTEDTTRSSPETIEYLFNKAIDNGASRVCVCDTVGCATPISTYEIVSFVKKRIIGKKNIKIDWHGHNDRGLAVANSLMAISAGADRLQGTILGIGERAGNASLIELIMNLYLEWEIPFNLKKLSEYAKLASSIFDFPLRVNDPIIGEGVFKTGTGVHASAIKKAIEMGDEKIAGLIYSAINPKLIGKKHEIVIGPMSGKANAKWILDSLSLATEDDVILKMLNIAKQERRYLSETEIREILKTLSDI